MKKKIIGSHRLFRIEKSIDFINQYIKKWGIDNHETIQNNRKLRNNIKMAIIDIGNDCVNLSEDIKTHTIKQ